MINTIKIGFYFCRDSLYFISDKLFDTGLSEGRPKVDIKVDSADKYPFPWFRVA